MYGTYAVMMYAGLRAIARQTFAFLCVCAAFSRLKFSSYSSVPAILQHALESDRNNPQRKCIPWR
jgi:hypothetical protein